MTKLLKILHNPPMKGAAEYDNGVLSRIVKINYPLWKKQIDAYCLGLVGKDKKEPESNEYEFYEVVGYNIAKQEVRDAIRKGGKKC